MRMLCIVVIHIFVFILIVPTHVIYASSQQAYRDYIYQYDQYRQTVNEYKSARSRYLKYKTLVSQTDALDKTKHMLSQRDELLLAYISLLSEKISENRGLPASEKEVHLLSLIGSTHFLETNKRKIPMLGDLDDATTVSADFEAQYSSMDILFRTILVKLGIGTLDSISEQYHTTYQTLQSFQESNRQFLSPEKQSIFERWLIQINNKQNLYKQKIDEIHKTTETRNGKTTEYLSGFNDIYKSLAIANTYLSEGISYMQELMTAVKYDN